MPPRRPELDPLSDTERAVFGPITPEDAFDRVDGFARRQLGSEVDRVLFRAGRIDAVWGVELADHRCVVVKTRRPPTDLAVVRAVTDVQRLLVEHAFPCPAPLAEPALVEGRVVTAETVLTGDVPDGRTADVRRLLADGLARHVRLLRERPDLVGRVGPGPSWCHYQAGPWPVPHDDLVDFRRPVAGYAWLDALGRRAADQILANRRGRPVVVGHADWYAGNTVVADGALTGTFDWELVADTEAVVAGFSAACFAARQTSAGGLSSPADVVAFLTDYEDARGKAFAPPERLAATGAATWIAAFNARWQVSLHEQGRSDDYASVTWLQERRDDYLDPGGWA